jgi:lysine-N-methylase
LTEAERLRLDEQEWSEKLGVAAYVRAGRGWALNKLPDGACVFLDEQNRCRIHATLGEAAKPLACRIFPFSVRPTEAGWQASLRFDCPSVTASKGEPIAAHRRWLGQLVAELEERHAHREESVFLKRGLRAQNDELDVLVARLSKWLSDEQRPPLERLVGAARLTSALEDARLKNVRGPRFTELVGLLMESLPAEAARPVGAATPRQRAMLRQYAFAHAEHATLSELRGGIGKRWQKRWRQLGSARQFLRGTGRVSSLPGFSGNATFKQVASIRGATQRVSEIEDLLGRYLAARISGQSVFGRGFYGWPAFRGLAACWLSVAAAGWLARYAAAAAGREAVEFEDAALALGVVDRAATRLPALGTLAERTRVGYLMNDDGVARLLLENAFVEKSA